jgi:hypothetical protein
MVVLGAPEGIWPGASAGANQPVDETDLPRVVRVVGGCARNRPTDRPPRSLHALLEGAWAQATHDSDEQSMLLLEQLHIPAPLTRAEGVSAKEIAAGQRERVSGIIGDAAPDNVLPVGGVDRNFRNVVPVGARPAACLPRGDAAQGAAQRRTMPRRSPEHFVKQGDEAPGFV